MKCPNCHFDNREGAKFCNQCGDQFGIACQNCGSKNPPGSKFCDECGQNIAISPEPTRSELTPREKIEKIQKYLPGGIVEKILAQKNKIEGEYKQVTVMFCDMMGFTPLTDRLGPEETYNTMDQVYEILIKKVHDYEGTVNEMTGDGIMALFGAPIALEDAPQRAIRSAMSIHREVTRFNSKVRIEKGDFAPIKMRIGIHTGPVVVGTLGNDLRVEFKAVGNTVNVAARMESLAEPGTTYVSEDTFKLTEGLFRFESLGEKKIKGKDEPIHVYQVIAPSTSRTRFDVSAESGLTPFVGRERERELLLDGFERVKEGSGQAMSIIGEAGTGKSRLLYEFRKSINNECVTFIEGRCLSYSRNEAYHPLADLLKSNFDIRDTDGDGEIRNKVVRGLKKLKVDEVSTLPYLLELLSVKESGIHKIPLSPEARKDRTLEALKKITLKGAELKPLIMAIEDIYWIDKSSEDVLKELVEIIPGARVFMIFTYRPGFVHTWGGRSYHSQVTLNRLSNRESLAMLTHILGNPYVDRDLEALILQKTEGIPFFIEEFIKSLKERQLIELKNHTCQLSKRIKKLAVPSTIQDVIMTRVDHLPEETKEVIRAGSVIEREFSYDLIKKITDLSDNQILSHLSALKDAELLYERGIFPQSTYIFKHNLTREVVYDSILTKKKKQLHAKIAKAIEEAFKEELCYHYGILANHCIASENHEKGAEYANLEARRYQKAALFKDAIGYATMSVNSLEKLPQTEANQKKLIDARTALAIYNLSLNDMVEAKDAVAPIMDQVLKMNYRKSLPAIYVTMGTYCLGVDEDFPKGIDYLNKAILISEEVGDAFSLWMACSQLGIFLPHFCEFDQALTYCNKCVDLSRLAKNPLGISISKAYLSYMYTLQGEISSACQSCKELLSSVEEFGDPYIKGTVYSHYGGALYYKGLFEEAEKYLLEGLTFCNKTSQVGWESIATARLGFMSFDRGLYGKAQDYHIQVIRLLEGVKMHPSWGNVQKTCLAKARVRANDRDVNLDELFEYYENNKMRSYEGFMARNIGDVMLHLDDHHFPDAETWIQKAIDADTRNGARWQLARDYALYAEWFKKKGDTSMAEDSLHHAIDIFKECGADGWAARTQESLVERA